MFWKKRDHKPEDTERSEPEASDTVVEEPPPRATGTTNASPEEGALDIAAAQLEARVIDAISDVYDPEIPVNIYELGLIYDIDIDGMGDAKIYMTLTSPGCPVAGTLPVEVQMAAESVDGIRSANVELVWDPPWTPDRMSEAARLELGFM